MPPKKESAATKDTSKETAKNTPNAYELHAKVLCQHLDNLYYEAKIINVEHSADGEPVYTVHYQGWNQRHDEKIKHSSTRSRFLEHTPANVERAKAEMKDAQARLAQNKRRNRKSNIVEEKRSCGADSRGSTPSDKRGASTSRADSITSDKGAVRKRKSGAQLESEPVVDFVRKIEIRIDIPLVLKDILVDDHDMINRQMYLSRLPARHTVSSIIRQYADYIDTSVEAKRTLTFEFGSDDAQLNSLVVTLIESSYGVQDYFNNSLGSQLLYKFERPQYADLLNQHKTKQVYLFFNGYESLHLKVKTKDTKRKRTSDVDKNSDSLANGSEKFKPSDFYGFIHLLRLFVRFGDMLALTNWSDRAVDSIVNQLQNFLKFLEANRHKFFDIESDYEVAPPEYQRRVWSS
ncbi:unnamed protein product [Thelazia callipaeda]|uniref:MRG domain-containing protein n=1 Tax=Thelazia callipaeda TaxID=103827 RepID=A0A0N5CQ03_THECL|nr:unnamed protein product [Thelazia callipaeda]